MVSNAIHLGHQLDLATLEALAGFVCGDNAERFPAYRSSYYLTQFFQSVGVNAVHDGSTRAKWVFSLLQTLEPSEIEAVILRLVDLREYRGDQDKLRLAVQSMNGILAMDNLGVGFENNRPVLKLAAPITIDEADLLRPVVPNEEQEFLREQYADEIDLSELGFESQVTAVLQDRVEEIRACPRDKVALGTIFLLGSTLEGVLLATAFSNTSRFVGSPSAPKDSQGQVLPIQNWKLANLIDVAHDLRLLDLDVKKFSHVLRDFRNYIHPYQQLSFGFKPDQHTADICWQVFKAAMAQLKRNLAILT